MCIVTKDSRLHGWPATDVSALCCREAQIEKKMARRDAARERDASPDLVKLPGGGDVMGGDDSLAAAKARQGRPFDEAAEHRPCLQFYSCLEMR